MEGKGPNNMKKRIDMQVTDLYLRLDAKRGQKRTGAVCCRLSCRIHYTAREKPCHRPAGVKAYDLLLG